MTAATLSAQLRKESRRFPPGSPDWEYRQRAAWKLHQIAHGIAPRDWTGEPPRWFTHDKEGVAA